MNNLHEYCITNLYKFTKVERPHIVKDIILKIMIKYNIKGTIILSNEGINCTISGIKKYIKIVITSMTEILKINDLTYRISYHNVIPFRKPKIKIKKEIVKTGINTNQQKIIENTYINPENWNKIILNCNILVLDIRNNYETKIGKFKNALTTNIKAFNQFTKYIENKEILKSYKEIAIYCTGGIRCEKLVLYLKSQRFKKIYQLQGGILNYLEKINKEKSLWQGECFVFDERISINHNLKKGKYEQCNICKNTTCINNENTIKYKKTLICNNCYKSYIKK